jgi:SRSO17 transposase
VTPEEITRIRPRLLEFADGMLADALRRKDQIGKGELYLRGLLTDGRRKSMQPMAERLGVVHQRLQQFVTNSCTVPELFAQGVSWRFCGCRAEFGAWWFGCCT